MTEPTDEQDSQDESENKSSGRVHINIESYLQKLYTPASDIEDWLKDPERWEPLLRKAVEDNPESYEALRDLGHFLSCTRQPTEAKQLLKNAIKLAPRDKDGASTWVAIGIHHFKEGDYDDAVHHFLEAINLSEGHYIAMYWLAHTYRQMSQYDEAEEVIEKAIEVKPDYIQAWLELAIIYANQTRYEECYNTLQNTVNIDPDNVDTWLHLGGFLIDMRRFDEAVIIQKKAIEVDSESWKAWQNLAYVYEEQGKKEEAAKCYRKARQFGALEMDDGEFYDPFNEDD
jgi:tetratricopeptide (TPR) repeat protein